SPTPPPTASPGRMGSPDNLEVNHLFPSWRRRLDHRPQRLGHPSLLADDFAHVGGGECELQDVRLFALDLAHPHLFALLDPGCGHILHQLFHPSTHLLANRKSLTLEPSRPTGLAALRCSPQTPRPGARAFAPSPTAERPG